jgi:hypothetical protein
MKLLLFLPGITDLTLATIGKAIRPFVTEEMGFLMIQKTAVINLKLNYDFPPEILIDMAKKFTNNPVFLVDANRIAFALNDEECLALFDEDMKSLQKKQMEEIDMCIDENYEEEENEIEQIVRRANSEINLDNILDKISSNGFSSLNRIEKKFLKNYGK